MIVKKCWLQSRPGKPNEWHREGWYLFGVVPLYVRDMTPRGRVVS